MDFKEYASEVASRFDRSPGAAANRVRMWRAAYRPLLGAVKTARRILDYGCGSGEFLEFLSAHASGEMAGFDPSESQLALARERLKGRRNVRLGSKLEPGPFDLIFCMHVVEHVPDEQLPEWVASVAQRLAPGGRLVIATPNGLNPFSYAYFMSMDRTHVRMHSPMTLAQILVPHGVEVLSVHRETPQAYDVMTACKTAVWWFMSRMVKLGILSTAGGVREHRLPFTFAATFYVVAGRSGPTDPAASPARR